MFSEAPFVMNSTLSQICRFIVIENGKENSICVAGHLMQAMKNINRSFLVNDEEVYVFNISQYFSLCLHFL